MKAGEKVVVHEEKSESDRMFLGSALFSASNKSKKYILCNQGNYKLHQCIKQFQNQKFENVSFYPKDFATFVWKQVIKLKPAVVIFIDLNVTIDAMFVFACLKIMVVNKTLMIAKIH